jgi:hypothetical protein
LFSWWAVKPSPIWAGQIQPAVSSGTNSFLGNFMVDQIQVETI